MKLTTFDLLKRKGVSPISVLTAYDYPTARTMEEAGVDVILVGDSLGNVVLGYENTLAVTVEDMIHHGKAVCRGAQKTFVVIDMPFLSYQVSVEDALRNAGRIVKETGCQAVKLEGGIEYADRVRAIVRAGIPVVGHIGLTPQSVNTLGGYRVQGKTLNAAKKLLEDARALEQAGAFSITLECVPEELARIITERSGVPTIGIGAGRYCDGQVLVFQDMLGYSDARKPKFAKQYADVHGVMLEAFKQYCEDCRQRTFPAKEHTFDIDQKIIDALL
ncbi:MAG: 3-methyl-2-oxobutanoate hydroxymethyltransferase [Bacteroidales bacterium]|nr:3-methyl-2-oxobutanoate hydroxymethyltransferase [Bacteroidales bacterium]